MLFNVIQQVASNELILLLLIQIPNSQTLQLFTKIIQTESIATVSKNAQAEGLGSDAKWSN
jgi:hypothetical protein